MQHCYNFLFFHQSQLFSLLLDFFDQQFHLISVLIVKLKLFFLHESYLKLLSGNEPGNLPSELPDSLPTDYLLKEIETKNNHIEEKDRQIEKLQLALETQQKLLDQQQQLTLQANQQIEKLQEQLQLTYTEESSENKSTTLSEETESIEKQSKTEKKWWQFWQ